MVKLEDIGAQIDPALDELRLYFALNIAAGEIGDCARGDLGDQ